MSHTLHSVHSVWSRRLRRALLLALPLCAALGVQGVQAQGIGAAIRLLVGYPPGGPADTAARIVPEKLALQLGQPVFVDNKPGAGAQFAAQALKATPADGSVIFISNTHTMAMVPLIKKTPGFVPASDFRMICTVATFELALAVHPKTGGTNLAELIGGAKSGIDFDPADPRKDGVLQRWRTGRYQVSCAG